VHDVKTAQVNLPNGNTLTCCSWLGVGWLWYFNGRFIFTVLIQPLNKSK